MPTPFSSKPRKSIPNTPAKSTRSSPFRDRSIQKQTEPRSLYDDIEGANASRRAISSASRQTLKSRVSTQNATPNKSSRVANDGVTPTSSVRKRGRPSLKDTIAIRESSEDPDSEIRRSTRERKQTQKAASIERDHRGDLSKDSESRKDSTAKKSLRKEEAADTEDVENTAARSKRERKSSAKTALIESARRDHSSTANLYNKNLASKKKYQGHDQPEDVGPKSTPLEVKRKRGRPPKVAVEQISHESERHLPSKRPLEEIESAKSVKRRKDNNANQVTPSKSAKSIRRTLDIDMDLDDELSFDTPSKKNRSRPAPSRKELAENLLMDEASSSEDPIRIDTKDKLIASPPVKVAAQEQEARATRCLANIVLEKVSGKRPIPLVHLDEEYAKVHNLVEATVVSGEGNSMVLIGARGTGKSTLVNAVLSDLAKTQKEYFHVIRLNGFIQTDDKLALREIWRQLGREMEIDEEAGKSYADTLTMLLALLSHPDEIAGERIGQVAKSVIFVMDEFDLFATHARQTLLYNLLDIAQSRKAPIAVIGLTTKFDVQESLEKRVKSRFSHRYVHVSLAKSMVSFQDICIAAMSVQREELSFEEKASLAQETAENEKRGKKLKSFDPLSDWNNSIKYLFKDPVFVSRYIRPPYHLTKSVSSVLSSLLLPINSILSQTNISLSYLLSPQNILSQNLTPTLQPPASTLPLVLSSLSDLQLALLIAAARLDVIHDSDTLTFAMAYAEYVELSSKARVQSAAAGALALGAGARVWGREVARGEWEGLVKLGLLVPLTEGASSMGAGGLVRIDVKLEEIPGAVPELPGTMERWCRQI